MSLNLIYNGDFSHGTDSWTSNGSVSVSGNVCTVNGDLYQDKKYLIPISRTGVYRISFDIKFTTVGSSTGNFYIAMRAYDNTQGTRIVRQNVNRLATATQTTLANAVANGDTTITVTDATGWTVPSTSNIGICNKWAWGYNRNIKYQHYKAINGNVITLDSAWSQGSYAAGTQVCEFLDGSTYDYWYYIAKSSFPTDWTTCTANITISNSSFMYSGIYCQVATLAYNHTYQIRNLRLERIDAYQNIAWEPTNINILKNGQSQAVLFNESGVKIRYVRDGTSGNTVNTNNHYCEFQVFNTMGENIALGKNLILYTGSAAANSLATDGIINSSYITNGSSPSSAVSDRKYLTFDNGFIEEVSSIKIWHYYPDGRTYYNNVVEISTDGINWVTVYEGEKPETAAGNEIILTNQKVSMNFNGELKAANFIEY